MFESSSHSRRCAAAACLAFALSTASLRSETSVGTAESFVRVAYDDLMREPVGVTVLLAPLVPGNPMDWTRLQEMVVRFRLQPSSPEVDISRGDLTVLEVGLSLDREGILQKATSKGAYVRTPDLDGMIRFAREHAKWSDSLLVAEIKQRGARFLDNVQDFESQARLRRFEPFAGRLVDVKSSFDVRVPNAQFNGEDVFRFEWRVVARTEPTPGQSADVLFTFEPFSGRLLSLRRSD